MLSEDEIREHFLSKINLEDLPPETLLKCHLIITKVCTALAEQYNTIHPKKLYDNMLWIIVDNTVWQDSSWKKNERESQVYTSLKKVLKKFINENIDPKFSVK